MSSFFAILGQQCIFKVGFKSAFVELRTEVLELQISWLCLVKNPYLSGSKGTITFMLQYTGFNITKD